MTNLASEGFRRSNKKSDDTYIDDLQMNVLSCSAFFPVLQNINRFSKTMYFRGRLRTKKRNKSSNNKFVFYFNSKGSLLKSTRMCFCGFIIWALVVGPLVTDITRIFFHTSNIRHFGVTPALACHPGHGQGSSRIPGMEVVPFQLHEHIPKLSEQTIGASGPAEGRIERGSARFQDLIENFNPAIVFNDEEENNEDRIMTDLCRRRLNDLAILVSQRWPNVNLRVTEAWDSEGRHLENSLHYEGRAVDITTSDLDRSKYPVLARLAVNAGFDWVMYNSKSHVHCSVKSESSQAVYKGRCFTGDSLVSRPNGKKDYMSVVKPGDDVYAVNSKGQIVTTRILTFLDIQYNAIGINFVAVELENGKVLKLTRNHLLYVSSFAENASNLSHMFDLNVNNWNKTIPGSNVKLLSPRPTFAGRVKPGQYVYVMDSASHNNKYNYTNTAILQPCKIISIRNIKSISGSYAPLTEVGNIIVDDVVASCYAAIENEALAHLVLTPVRYFHIVRLWLKSKFKNNNFESENNYCNTNNSSNLQFNQCNFKEGISMYSYILQTIGSYIFSKAVFWMT